MARKKKTATAIINKAETRLVGLKTINAKLDLGGGMSVMAFEKEIATIRAKINAYNTILTKADDAANELEVLEKNLAESSSRMLAGVLTRYGRDSSEYEMAGGVRLSDRKRRKIMPKLEEPALG